MRLDAQQLESIAPDEFKRIAIDAAKRAAEDYIDEQEKLLLQELEERKKLEAVNMALCVEIEERLRTHRQQIALLMSNISVLRWQRRAQFGNSFQQEDQQDEYINYCPPPGRPVVRTP